MTKEQKQTRQQANLDEDDCLRQSRAQLDAPIQTMTDHCTCQLIHLFPGTPQLDNTRIKESLSPSEDRQSGHRQRTRCRVMFTSSCWLSVCGTTSMSPRALDLHDLTMAGAQLLLNYSHSTLSRKPCSYFPEPLELV